MKGLEEEGRWSVWNCCVLLLQVRVFLLSSLLVTRIQVSQLSLCPPFKKKSVFFCVQVSSELTESCNYPLLAVLKGDFHVAEG